MKNLSLKDSRRLVWLTWIEFLITGMIVYFSVNPLNIAVVLAIPIALHALFNFWRKSDRIPVRIYSVVPAVFLPTAFLTGLGALCVGLVDEILNPWSLALATVCILSAIASYPESHYADYEGNLRKKNPLIIVWRIYF